MTPRFDTFEPFVKDLERRAHGLDRPYFVALDGRSAAGKTMLAGALAEVLDAAVIEGDDFYAGGVGLRTEPPAALVAACIDWRHQRIVLEALRAGRQASWHAFDWETFDGGLCAELTVRTPRPIVILEGIYSARPELADLIDLSVLVRADEGVRESRLLARDGVIGPWERQWHFAEEYYFEFIRPPTSFDMAASEMPI
jgi:para-aminobenzoate synthetase